ncbi:hypothetical protein ACFYKX_13585 [Cytobacillus sp. FJAT-54145]|uniref:Uncharacterized protein n=1 Tax=Cytobacillus spartinae TaxID=3299023 RepID=A0ABW6KEF3_9BACI
MEEVMYNGELYLVIFKYDSGYWEIRKKNATFVNVLIHHTEVEDLFPL